MTLPKFSGFFFIYIGKLLYTIMVLITSVPLTSTGSGFQKQR